MMKIVACRDNCHVLAYNFVNLLIIDFRERSFMKTKEELKNETFILKKRLKEYSKMLPSGRFEFVRWDLEGLYRVPIIRKV